MVPLSSRSRFLILLFAIVTFVGPNGMFLYYAFSRPELMQQANANPIALAFMIEAMMMLGLFLVFIWRKSKSVAKVLLYLFLSFIGSLAFSVAIYIYRQNQPVSRTELGV